MGKFIRAILVAAAATAVTYVVVAAASKSSRSEAPRKATVTPTGEIEAEDLPPEVREGLVAELDGHV